MSALPTNPMLRLLQLATETLSDDGLHPALQAMQIRAAAAEHLAEEVRSYIDRPVELYPELARVRDKLARRLYSPDTEADVNTLLGLLTDALAGLEVVAGGPGGPAVGPACEYCNDTGIYDVPHSYYGPCSCPIGQDLSRELGLDRLRARVAELEAATASERKPAQPAATSSDTAQPDWTPPAPDEWNRTEMRAEMKRVEHNLSKWATEQPTYGWRERISSDMRSLLSALARADAVIHAQANDINDYRLGARVEAGRADELQAQLNAVRAVVTELEVVVGMQ